MEDQTQYLVHTHPSYSPQHPDLLFEIMMLFFLTSHTQNLKCLFSSLNILNEKVFNYKVEDLVERYKVIDLVKI